TDAQAPDALPHATALERPGDARLCARGPAPLVRVWSEANGARPGALVAPGARRPLGWLPLWHPLETLTRGTGPVHQRHRRSPSPLSHGGVLPLGYQRINCIETSPAHGY